MKKMSQVLRTKYADNLYKYVGTIYGDADSEWAPMTGQEIAEIMEEFGDDSPEIDHPANGGRDGFYFESWNICCHNHQWGKEVVFKAVD